MRLRAAVVDQEHALAEQMAKSKALKPSGAENGHMGMYQEEYKGSGGFAGADTKKRRGVSCPVLTPSLILFLLSTRTNFALYIEGSTSWSLSQLQPGRNTRMAPRS